VLPSEVDFVAGTFLFRIDGTETWEFRLHARRSENPARTDVVELTAPVTRRKLEAAVAALYDPLGLPLVTRISRPGQGLHIARIRRTDDDEGPGRTDRGLRA